MLLFPQHTTEELLCVGVNHYNEVVQLRKPDSGDIKVCLPVRADVYRFEPGGIYRVELSTHEATTVSTPSNSFDSIELHQAHFVVQMGGGGDIWRLHGQVFGHPNLEPGEWCYPSTPAEFNSENQTFTTKSGKKYVIRSIRGDTAKFWQDMTESIAGYKVI